jgi:cardiolipin synthase
VTHSLIVLPDDGAAPLLSAIEAARKSLRVKMFLFSDPSLMKAVVAARKRGCARDAESRTPQR